MAGLGLSLLRHDRTKISETIGRVESRLQRLEEIETRMKDSDVEEVLGASACADCTGTEPRPLQALMALMTQTAPIPMWIKNKEGLMIWYNKAYESQYGAPIDEYIGQQNTGFWDEDSAKVFDDNDERVKQTLQPLFAFEELYNKRTQETEHLHVIKWPIISRNEALVGVAGLALGIYRLWG